MDQIVSRGTTFIDQHGRQRLFRGINFVDKNNNREPRSRYIVKSQDLYMDQYLEAGKKEKPKGPVYLDDELLDACQQAGFNMIRLGFNWCSVEPEPGQYNDAYLDDIADILDRCARRNIYVFLNMHQDLYSTNRNGEGNGAPAWACMMDGLETKPMRFVWAEGYWLQKAVHRAFDHFWDNTPYRGKGLQDYYADMWKHVAGRFKDKPALFGFDMFNEPFPGSSGGKVFRKVISKLIRVSLVDRKVNQWKLLKDLCNPKMHDQLLNHYDNETFHKIVMAGADEIREFDTKRFSPFINKVAAAIRTVTDKGIFLIENCYYSNLGIPCSTPAITIDGKREAQQCFSPHAYDLLVDTDGYKYASNERVAGIFAQQRAAQQRMQVPVIVGEWGAHAPGTLWLPHIEFIMDLFDSYQWSNTYYYYLNNFFQMPLIQIISRPYPIAVAGKIEEFHYDTKKKQLTLRYHQAQDSAVPTEIYLPGAHRAIQTDGEYTVIPVPNSKACHVHISTAAGEHSVIIDVE